jgi:C4-dicarboxylate-specific signal transduction histidine kinase
MENLIQRFEQLKNLLTQRASTALGEALLSAFLSSLSDYETAVVKSLTVVGKDLADLRGENELLRGLLGNSEPEMRARILSQGEELRFLREQLCALKKELDERGRANDTLRLENEALEADVQNVQRLREEEQNRFKKDLDTVKGQLKAIGQRTFEKQQQMKKDSEAMAKGYADKERQTYLLAEDELRSVAVKLHALCKTATGGTETCISTVEAARPASGDEPAVSPNEKKGAAALPDTLTPVLAELSSVLEKNKEANLVVEQYLNLLDRNEPRYVKVSWARYFMELKKRLSDIPRRQNVKIAWPNEKALPPFITDEKMLVDVSEALVRNALESLSDEGTVDISAQLAPGSLVLHVLDSGQGVKPQDKEKVFLPFFTTKAGHLGMGLARAKKLTRTLGGTITCEPKGIGTLFVLAVPGQDPAVVKAPPRTKI